MRSNIVLEGNVSGNEPYIQRTFANCCPEMIFHYKGPFAEISHADITESSFLTGVHAQTTKVRRFIVKEHFGILGVHLEPYAIPALFGKPATEITDELPDLSALLGQEGKDLEEQVMDAAGNDERLRMIISFLERKIGFLNRPEIMHAAQAICGRKGNINLKELAHQSCLSQRQFERKFKELIGFTPKLFSRIVRFNALLSKPQKAYRSLTEVAYDFGYYDQAHFIQDFKEFSGYNPGLYFSGKAGEIFYEP